MNRTALWRYILILCLIALGLIYALPNIFGEDPAVQITRVRSVTGTSAPVEKSVFLTKIKTILKQPSAEFKQGITAKSITIPSSIVNGKNIVDGDTQILFYTGKEQEQALVELKQGLDKDKYSIAMSMAPRTPGWLKDIGADPMTLGLDLRGGIHFLLRVDVQSLIKTKLENDQWSIRSKLQPVKGGRKIHYDTLVTDLKKHNLTFTFDNKKDLDDAESRLSDMSNEYRITTQDSTNKLTLQLLKSVIKLKTRQAMSRNIQTLSEKINKLGVAEPEIQQQGEYNISVDLPGVQDVARARAAIGTVAKVELHLVQPNEKKGTRILTAAEQCDSNTIYTRKVPYNDSGLPGQKVYACIDPDIALPGRAITDAHAGRGTEANPIVSLSLSGSSVAHFTDVTTENVGMPLGTLYMITTDKIIQQKETGGAFTLHISASKSANTQMQNITNKLEQYVAINHVGGPLNPPNLAHKYVIVTPLNKTDFLVKLYGLGGFDNSKKALAENLTDGVKLIKSTQASTIIPVTKSVETSTLINSATILEPLSYSFNITFGSDGEMSQAQALAQQLRSGAYAAPVSFVAQQKLGPSMGKQNIRKGVLSCLIGSLLVILFMALYYRLFGLVANLALILNVVFVVAIMSILGATMTVPGIAGIILTVGMAVDANVLINERIREELRLGVSNQAAIKAGYERAFSTIVDANVTTLLVACVLYGLGSGTVKGFAVTLTIGLITSMFTSIFFTRAIINLIYGKRNVKNLSIGIKVK